MTNHLMTPQIFLSCTDFFSSDKFKSLMHSKAGQHGSISGYFVFLVIWLSANTIFILLKEVCDDSLSPAIERKSC